MRISLDNRYQDARLPIAEHMLHPHMGAVDWPTVYGSDPVRHCRCVVFRLRS